MIEAYISATHDVLRLAGQMFLARIDYELRRFAEDLHDFLYDLDRNPTRDWRARFDAFLADESSRGRDISPESRQHLIQYLEIWERNVFGADAESPLLQAVITRVEEQSAAPPIGASEASFYSSLLPRKLAGANKSAGWWPFGGDTVDFYRKLNDARGCIYDLERMLPSIASRIDAAKPGETLEIDDELNAIESLVWRHNDLMESAREIWLRENLGAEEFAELDLGPNPASLGLPLFTDARQADRAKAQLKRICHRLNQKIAFLDNVIFTMKVIETAGNIASFAMAGGVLIHAVKQGGKIALVKTVATMAASQVVDELVDAVTEKALKAVGLNDEQIAQVRGAVEIISTVLLLRRVIKPRPEPPLRSPPAPERPRKKRDKSWKAKISGRAQKTGTDGHQFRSYREAIKEAKDADVVSVHLDHGYNRVSAPQATVRTNAQLVDEIGTRAGRWAGRTRQQTKLSGRSPSDIGTHQHSYAKRLLDRYQRIYGDRGLRTEVRYFEGSPLLRGQTPKGSIRLDVVEGDIFNPTAVYDYKFGTSGLSTGRITQIRAGAGLSLSIPVIEVRP